MSVIDARFVASASGDEPLAEAGPSLTPEELATLATRALKRPETISVDEIRILAGAVLVQVTGQAA